MPGKDKPKKITYISLREVDQPLFVQLFESRKCDQNYEIKIFIEKILCTLLFQQAETYGLDYNREGKNIFFHLNAFIPKN